MQDLDNTLQQVPFLNPKIHAAAEDE